MTPRSDLFPRDHHDDEDDPPAEPRHPRPGSSALPDASGSGKGSAPRDPDAAPDAFAEPGTPGLPEADDLTGEVATVPGPDLTPSRTEEVEPPPGTPRKSR
ncbi:hypothetical protein ATK36_5817 [Amycolatopsis sulphurea]|uniref:Uncharacterized protein n=1 Tax=Amycolatopsis sulphurea TaxID=76022 RepID=A0A2A9FIJ6_9PSEU|nr:hypothetical protein [Amycolatopsis sulphurea]PFG50576.1 hypothetical protein ATK36_5817 [Amycolatopsis sulphurea]